MKKLLLALALFSAGAVADEKSKLEQDIEYCEKFGTIAKVAMESRQNNVAYTEMLKISHKQGEAFVFVVEKAYEKPRYDTEKYQLKAVHDFVNEMEVACMKARK